MRRSLMAMRGHLIRGRAILQRAAAISAGALVLIATACPAAAEGARPFSGLASFYDKNYSGKTAAGERYDGAKFTAAHRTLPFGTRVVVTDKRTKRSVTVTVNDRGPFIKGRVLDLSYAAAVSYTHLRAHETDS